MTWSVSVDRNGKETASAVQNVQCFLTHPDRPFNHSISTPHVSRYTVLIYLKIDIAPSPLVIYLCSYLCCRKPSEFKKQTLIFKMQELCKLGTLFVSAWKTWFYISICIRPASFPCSPIFIQGATDFFATLAERWLRFIQTPRDRVDPPRSTMKTPEATVVKGKPPEKSSGRNLDSEWSPECNNIYSFTS